MKAVTINKWGKADVLKMTEIAKPCPKENQLLLNVFSSSVNPVDWKHRKGNHKFILGSPFPIVLGYDICGEVVEVGNEVSKFKLGDIVFGDLNNKYGGALAEFALGEEICFAKKPSNISAEEAAAFPLVSLTAFQALTEKINIQKSQTIMINGASGGVGHIAVQIAKILGAKVIAVASERNRDFVLSLGADKFIDYTAENFLNTNAKVDAVFDCIGNLSLPKTRKILKPKGIFVSILPRPKVLFHKVYGFFAGRRKAKTILRKHSSENLEQIAGWISERKLKINIDKVFDISEIREAHIYSESGRATGKIVIQLHKKETNI